MFIFFFSENYKIPPLSILTIYPYILHRDGNIYPNPEEFIPERFLDEDNKTKFLFGYLPFSAGSRNCIGNSLNHFIYSTFISSQNF